MANVEPDRTLGGGAGELDRFSRGTKRNELLDRYGLRGKRILLTVGRLDPDERRKGHDRVIQALPEVMQTFPDVVYLVVGHGEDRARLEALARNLGVENGVLFSGRVTPDELPHLYRLANLFVMPSTQEGFGIVFLEAAASGVRVIGGNADGSTDALADGVVGFTIDPANVEALTDAIKEGFNGGGPDPADVRRFGFENFAGHVHELVRRHLLSAESLTI
jgi:phosphatidylinositol alpha-1,6-mannosyltransferase